MVPFANPFRSASASIWHRSSAVSLARRFEASERDSLSKMLRKNCLSAGPQHLSNHPSDFVALAVKDEKRPAAYISPKVDIARADLSLSRPT